MFFEFWKCFCLFIIKGSIQVEQSGFLEQVGSLVSDAGSRFLVTDYFNKYIFVIFSTRYHVLPSSFLKRII